VIRLVLADAQPLFRDAVARVLRQDPEVQLLAEVAGGRAAVAAIAERRPDVALVAVDLPDLPGDRVLAAAVRAGSGTRVVLIDAVPGLDAWSLLGEGAAGVLSRRVSADALRTAVHRVARGQTALCHDAQTAVAGEVRARAATSDRSLLSPREQQVLDLVADGLTAPQIARRLQLAPSTIRTHHKHLLAKLEARDRAQLVRHAMRRKLLD
jgi:two-component system nitrate/nitrite response regulator NarL